MRMNSATPTFLVDEWIMVEKEARGEFKRKKSDKGNKENDGVRERREGDDSAQQRAEYVWMVGVEGRGKSNK